ncbi:MAG: thioredoxin family protein [bacterium]
MKPSAIATIVVVIIAAGVVVALKQDRSSSNSKDQTADENVLRTTARQEPGDLPQLVDLGAGKCIPCKMMAPILEELSEEYKGRLDVDFIDVWEEPEAGDSYGVRMIPTQIFFDASGTEIFRHEGFYSKEDILAKWRELGVNLDEGETDEPTN